MSSYDTIEVSHSNGVAIVTLARPDRLNAIVPAMFEELDLALTEIADARCIVLTGKGRAFCAGADLAPTATGSTGGLSDGEARAQRISRIYNPVFQRLSMLSIPIVAAVNGPAVGMGASIAMMGDFILMSEDAYFINSFTSMGLAPDGGASWVLPRLIGKARATQMLLLGERIDAATALDWGLIYRNVPADRLLAEAMALAERLASGATLALGMTRQMIASALTSDLAQALEREADCQGRATDTADASEAVLAFREKRKPSFAGR